jgi:hypothetical protein
MQGLRDNAMPTWQCPVEGKVDCSWLTAVNVPCEMKAGRRFFLTHPFQSSSIATRDFRSSSLANRLAKNVPVRWNSSVDPVSKTTSEGPVGETIASQILALLHCNVKVTRSECPMS